MGTASSQNPITSLLNSQRYQRGSRLAVITIAISIGVLVILSIPHKQRCV
jgi:hypothetical protein